MAKLEKIGSKQMPQVIGLGVLCLGLAGYVGFTFLGSKPAPKDASAKRARAMQVAEVTPEMQQAAGGNAPATPAGMPLSNEYNPDPFRPDAALTQNGTSTKPAPAAKPAPKPAVSAPKVTVQPQERQAPAATAPETVRPVAPPPPPRPDVVVTGTIVTKDGMDMVLADLGQEHVLFQTGDLVGNGYRIKKITMNGAWLDNGKDRFFVTRGVTKKDGAQQTASASVTQ